MSFGIMILCTVVINTGVLLGVAEVGAAAVPAVDVAPRRAVVGSSEMVIQSSKQCEMDVGVAQNKISHE